MNRRTNRLFLRGVLAALATSAVFAASASAGPVWKFDGEELKTTEVIVGAAQYSSMTIPGLTTKCENFLYEIAISNSAGTGKGSVTDLPLFNCTTDSKYCSVETIAAETLPWAASLTTISSKNYIKIEGVKVGIIYVGALCSVDGTLVVVKGNAGGRIDNETESATFDPSTFSATGTALKALGSTIKWEGFFPSEAFEVHREDVLSVS